MEVKNKHLRGGMGCEDSELLVDGPKVNRSRPTNTNPRGKTQRRRTVGPDCADSDTRILKRQPSPIPTLIPFPSSATEAALLLAALPARPPARSVAHHAAPPRHLLLAPNHGAPLDAAASVRFRGGGGGDD